MSEVNVFVADTSWNYGNESVYPEWVTNEKMYKCENFRQIFERREPLLKRLFSGRRAVR